MFRRHAVLLILTALAGAGATRVTVEQLESMLKRRRSDANVAASLVGVELRERIPPGVLERLLAAAPGPRTRDVLELMSLVVVPLPAPVSPLPVPPPERQQEILQLARAYGALYVRGLPDFLCTRVTRHFDDIPDPAGKRPEVWSGLRLRNIFVGELSYHRGGESYKGPSQEQAGAGMSSFGEFGGIIIALLAGRSSPDLTWSHWEENAGRQVAVYRYAVPAERSQYTVGYCCVSGKRTVTVQAAYRGEIHLDAGTGAVLRVLREAVDLPPDFATRRAETVVDYGPVGVGPPGLLLPLRSVTVSESLAQTQRGRMRVRYLNDVRFVRYHKFGAESRLTGGDVEPPLPDDAGR